MIPVERTDPSFDVGTLLNGYEPLFSVLNPRDADNLTKGVLQSLQGDQAAITTLVEQTSRAYRGVRGSRPGAGQCHHQPRQGHDNLAAQNANLDDVLAQTRTMVSTFDNADRSWLHPPVRYLV